MNLENSLEKKLADEEIAAVEYLYLNAEKEYDEALEKGAQFPLCHEAEKNMWSEALRARENGKKIVLYAGAVPPELLWSFNCVPVNMDFVQIRLAKAKSHTRKLVFEADKILPDCFCSMDKSMLGLAAMRRLGIEPDAFVFASAACDASRHGYSFTGRALGVPLFEFDIPAYKGEHALESIVEQLEKMCVFMEDTVNHGRDDDLLRVLMERSNRSFALMDDIAKLRRVKPCPLPGRMLIKNGYAAAFPCLQGTEAFLEEELKAGKFAAQAGKSPCMGGEKHRAAFIQNMIWSAENITDWLEEEYGCSCTMDAAGLVPHRFFENTGDMHDCLTVMAGRMRNEMTLHGVSWSGTQLLEHVDRLFSEYEPDVSIFAGHVGCRQTWAAVRMISNTIMNKYGIPTLELHVDGIDRGYKDEDDIKSDLSEYMENVVNMKH